MVNVVQYNVDVYGCGLRDLVPLVGSLSVLVTVRVYAGGHSAILFLLSIKSTKSYISLVTYMIFIYKDAWSHEHKILTFYAPTSNYATYENTYTYMNENYIHFKGKNLNAQ
jgi:hypothetical protein